MRNLVFDEFKRVSGATYGLCTIEEYSGPSVVETDYNYQSPMLMLSQALSAAFFGCIGGLAGGKSIPACVIGGGIGAATTTMGFFIEDAYWMYQKAKN